MSETTQLVRYAGYTLILDSPDEMRDAAIEALIPLGKVTNHEEYTALLQAKANAEQVVDMVENSCDAVVEPHYGVYKEAKKTSSEYTKDLRVEILRAAIHLSDYIAIETAKLKAAEAARMDCLSDIDRRRQQERAKAKTHDELDEIDARYNEEAKALPPVPELFRVEGQRLTQDWEITVIDPHVVARCHPNLMRWELNRTETKFLLNQGVKIPGIMAKKIYKVTAKKKDDAIAI